MKELVRRKLIDSGAAAVGFAKAGEVHSGVSDAFNKWIGEGRHAEMDYLRRHVPLRRHTDNVLPGARTVISLAFSYAPQSWRDSSLPSVAAYAYGSDYHFVLRQRLQPIVNELQDQFGGNWRICIDSAPLEERYWALKAGLGIRGKNGSVIVEGCGSLCFLAEILTTLEIDPDEPSLKECNGCGACVSACPSSALNGDGTIDSRLCLNYLSIEKKGEFSDWEKELISRYPVFLGCDRCLKACPHNCETTPSEIEEFRLSPLVEGLSSRSISLMNDKEFRRMFKNTPFERIKLKGLKRNAGVSFEDETPSDS